MLKIMNKTIGKTRLKPNPVNILLIIPAIYLGFKNKYENNDSEQTKKNCE